MSYKDIMKYLEATWPVRDKIVPCLVGPVGIGKTAAVEEHARNHGANLVTITLQGCQPFEVSGMVMPDPDKKAMEIFDSYDLGHLKKGDILFFDELLEAEQYILSACLTLIESRMMASGRRMDDIQIIAACNATTPPHMLKESIRQRFLWRRFYIDKAETRQYIMSQYNIDVEELVDLLVETGPEYNFLSPRSLTKMAYWMSTANDKDQAHDIASEINAVWKSELGTKLYEKWAKNFCDPMKQARDAIRGALCSTLHDPEGALNEVSPGMGTKIFREDFQQDSLEEIMEVLRGLGGWDIIEASLSSQEVEEPEEMDINY